MSYKIHWMSYIINRMSYIINRMSYIINQTSLLFRKWMHFLSFKSILPLYVKSILSQTAPHRVLTCVVGVTEITTFFVAGRLTSQVGPLHAIMQTSTPGQLADQHVRSIIRLVWYWLDHFWKVIFTLVAMSYMPWS